MMDVLEVTWREIFLSPSHTLYSNLMTTNERLSARILVWGEKEHRDVNHTLHYR